ncbi:ubiquitin-related domain-containing protein [Bisporella sp. PMI_857]|nr:ubiquitin-related domain-containing protein [Bisporella sp. PMI_857]
MYDNDSPAEEGAANGAGSQDISKGERRVNIVVIDSNDNELQFQLKAKTKLGKLMDAYCKEKNIDPGSCRFHFDGKRLLPDDTPKLLEMGEGKNEVKVNIEQLGGQ